MAKCEDVTKSEMRRLLAIKGKPPTVFVIKETDPSMERPERPHVVTPPTVEKSDRSERPDVVEGGGGCVSDSVQYSLWIQ